MGTRGPPGAVGPPGPQGETGASGPIGEVLSPWPYQNVGTLFILHAIRTRMNTCTLCPSITDTSRN